MKNAVIYTRVSTEEQTKPGHHSLDAQKTICRKVAADMEYQIVQVFEDPGRSATTMNRPALKDMIIRCQEDKSVAAVFVQDTDRLARNTNDHLSIKAVLAKAGVQVISASQPTLDDSAEGKMIDTMVAAVNQFQSDITARKTLKGMEEKVRKGGWPREAPVGYKNVGDEKGNRIIVPDEIYGPMVTEAFKMFATGTYTVHRLNETMYEKGLRSRTGLKMQLSKMNYLLKNRFYISEIRWSDITAKGNYPPLVDEKTFNDCQRVIEEHNRFACRTRKHEYLLSGFVYCGICNHRYTGESHLEKNARYYRCAKREGHREKFTKMEDLELQVEGQFKNLQFSTSFIEKVVSKVKGMFEAKKHEIERQKAVLLTRQRAVEQRRDVAEEKLFSGLISDDDFERVRQKYQGQIDGIQDEINGLERVREVKVDVVQKVLDLTRDIHHAYQKAPFRLKRQYLTLFWERFEVRDTRIAVATPTRLFRALQGSVLISPQSQQIAHDPATLSARGPSACGLESRGSLPSLRAVHVAEADWGDHHPIRSRFKPLSVQTETGWGDQRELHPQPSVPQTDALLIELWSPHT